MKSHSDISPDTPIDTLFRLNPLQIRGLKKLRITTVRDALYHFPSRYGNPLVRKSIAELRAGDKASIVAQVTSSRTLKAYRKRIPMAEVVLADESGEITAMWYHQAYMAKKVPEGHWATISGTVSNRKGTLYFANPEIAPASGTLESQSGSLFTDGSADDTLRLAPVYPESRGLSSLWLHHAIEQLLRERLHEQIEDPLPPELLEKYHLPSLATALIWIHAPKQGKDAETARKRFAFEEIFCIQLGRQLARQEYEQHTSYKTPLPKKERGEFVSRFPFPLTSAQQNAIETILNDVESPRPMLRLLEGDVGSGKTAVAATIAYAAVRSGYEVAYMAPTEILAKQHFESFIKYFKDDETRVGLITGSECRKFPSKISTEHHTHISKPQLLKWVANGEIPIIIGTHALIQKNVLFKKLALVIIDEQHRFGVNQRLTLAKKRNTAQPFPHLLSMTATPIPRTLALTLYGDLDLSLLDEMPAGRKPIITEIIHDADRAKMYEALRRELRAGRQAYVICPRIDEPDPDKELSLEAKSVTEEAKRLANDELRGFSLAVLHGKMKPTDKESVMSDFLAHRADVLVATSVVEVGVNVPNATVIVIEGAERFGLAQLHQLRGRVIRSNHQAYCFCATDSKSGKAKERLEAIKNAKNGFELSERDLEIRGPGELSGMKQWGISDVGMDAIKNIKMVEAARSEAQTLIAKDPILSAHPLLRARIASHGKIHFE